MGTEISDQQDFKVTPVNLKRFRRGEVVVVRDADEILQTLDDNGTIDGLLFMPEMVQYCGQAFTVGAQAERLCDTINGGGCRRMPNTVLLEGLRCDGGSHGGCQAECLIYWNEAWLRRADWPATSIGDVADASERLLALVTPMTRQATVDGDVRYKCQATEMPGASTKVSNRDPRAYLREYLSGNVTLRRFVRVMSRALVLQSLSKIGLLHSPPMRGPSPNTPPSPAPLGLEPGEWVRIKSKEEIRQTLNDKGTNKGLWFDRELMAMCGREFKVRKRIERFIDDRSGRLVELKSDCISLEGGVCMSESSLSRWFCPREIYAYWRECWLERIDTPAEVTVDK